MMRRRHELRKVLWYNLLGGILLASLLSFRTTHSGALASTHPQMILSLHSKTEDFSDSSSTYTNDTSLSSARLAQEYYAHLLDQYPLFTKSLTAAIVSLVGDILAQVCLGNKTNLRMIIDWERVGSVSAEGFFVSGPLLHLAYDWMDTHLSFMADGADLQGASLSNATTTTMRSSKMLHSLLQVGIDIFVMDSFFAMTLMLVSALLQRRTLRQIYHEIKSDSLSAILAAWGSSLLLSPLQFCNFQFIPVQYRVLMTNFQDVIWNAAVSYTAHRNRGDVNVVSLKEKRV